ncbi:MAG: glycosyltransferase family 39 protein, partial [Gemmatimonadota bacterium]
MNWAPAHSPMLSTPRRATIALLLATVLTRLPALVHPKAIDDAQVYSVVAIEMLHGGRPYIDAIERKPPLLFALYEAILSVGGAYNPHPLQLTALLWTLATMAVVGLIARRLFDPATGLTAALLYGLFLAWGDYRNLALNGELLMNLPVALALAITFGPSKSRIRPELLLAGALVASAFLLKQPSGIAALPLGLYLLHPAYRNARRLDWGNAIVQGALLTLGFVAVFALTGFSLWKAGNLREAIYWTVLSQEAAFGAGSWIYWDRALSNSALFLACTLPLVGTAILSVREAGRKGGIWQDHRAEIAALLILLGVSVVGVGANGQFLYHYYLQLILPLALLAAPIVRAILVGQRSFAMPLLRPAILSGWLALSAVGFLVADTIGLSRNRARSSSALYVRAHSRDDDRLFVWGQGTRMTGMYLDAERRPATRYIASFPLTGHIFGSPVSWDPNFDTSDRIVPGSWEHLRQDFERHPPRYIIDTDAVRARPIYVMSKYPFLGDYVSQNFREVFRAADGVV